MIRRAFAALLVMVTASHGAVTFIKKPLVSKKDAGATVSFTVSENTDVAVYVLDAKGKVVRHLVAGVLGEKAPAPFNPGLSQSIEWDGKDDDGNFATGGPFSVRVALGLNPTFDTFLMYNPDAIPRLQAIAGAPDGEIYAFHNDSVSNGNQGGLKIRVLDREGCYKRMLLPFPADLPYEKVKPMRAFKDAEGRLVPRLQNYQTLSLWPDTMTVRGRTLNTISPAADSKGGVHWLIRGGRIVSLDSRGGCPYRSFLGPELFPDDAAMVINNRYKTDHAFLAVGENDKYLYISGLRRSADMKSFVGIPCIYRVDLSTRSTPKVFIGDPNKPGAAGKLLTEPKGVVCSQGVLYVTDAKANRVVAFSEKDGSLVGEFKATAPNFIGIDSRSGAIYVIGGTSVTKPILTKFDGIKTGKPVCKVDLPPSNHTEFMNHSMALDSSGDRVRIWVSVRAYKRDRVCAVEDEGASLKVRDEFLEPHSKWNEIPQDLSVDRKRGELYVRGQGHTRIDERTGEIKGKIFSGRRKGKGQVAVCPDGNLVTLSNRIGLERWAPDGSPLAWEGAPNNKPEHTGVTEVIMTLGPVGNLAVRGDEIYVVNFGSSEGMSKRLEVFGMDGKLKRIAVYGCNMRANPRLDARGNIYLAEPVKTRGKFCPEFFDDKIDPATELKSYRNAYNYLYGSIVKYPPSGGAMYYTGAKKGSFSPADVPEEIRKKPTIDFSYPSHAYGKIQDGTAQGAEWIRMGFAPFSSTGGAGTAFCHCENAGFDVDGFGRVFYPNLGQFRVEMIDTDNNWIGSFGHYGNQDSGGPDATVKVPEIPLAWPAYVAVSDKYAYVSDSINLRIVKVRLDYAADETVEIK